MQRKREIRRVAFRGLAECSRPEACRQLMRRVLRVIKADGTEFEDLKPVLARPPLAVYVRELWSRRKFISTMPLNQMRATNMDTALGNFW